MIIKFFEHALLKYEVFGYFLPKDKIFDVWIEANKTKTFEIGMWWFHCRSRFMFEKIHVEFYEKYNKWKSFL